MFGTETGSFAHDQIIDGDAKHFGKLNKHCDIWNTFAPLHFETALSNNSDVRQALPRDSVLSS
jgi:hypothetical protein